MRSGLALSEKMRDYDGRQGAAAGGEIFAQGPGLGSLSTHVAKVNSPSRVGLLLGAQSHHPSSPVVARDGGNISMMARAGQSALLPNAPPSSLGHHASLVPRGRHDANPTALKNLKYMQNAVGAGSGAKSRTYGLNQYNAQ